MNKKKLDIDSLMKMSLKDYKKHFKFLGEGIARQVFALDNKLVVKVAKGLDGRVQNFVENYTYNNCTSQERKYLCPVLYYNDYILIMPRATPYISIIRNHPVCLYNLRSEKTVDEDIIKLSNKFLLFLDDLYAPSSWGHINNEYYLIDYGCTTDQGDYFYIPLLKNSTYV